VQTSPFSPTPPELRSGRSLPAVRSASSPTTLRLFIGDGDGTFRRALRASIASDPAIDVVGEADDGAQALELLRWLRPDVALVDEDMPSFGGAAIARILRTELPETRVVVLTRATAGARR
jgi:DNA-binding NarL/FixJ family response regulator